MTVREPTRCAGLACAAAAISVLFFATGCGSSSNGSSSSGGRQSALSSELVHVGQFTVCASGGAPPESYQNASGTFEGFDPSVARAVASGLGLKPVFVNSNIDTLVEAVETGKCDAAVAGLSMTPERLQAVTMIPYWLTGDGMLVAKGNPKHISGSTSTCGDSLSTVLGSVEDQRIAQWSAACTAAGKPAIHTVTVPTVSAAYEALMNHQVDGLLYEIDFLGNEVQQHPTLFQLAGPELGDAPSAIAISQQHTALKAAIIRIIQNMQRTGSWNKLLERFGFQTREIANPTQTTLPSTSPSS